MARPHSESYELSDAERRDLIALIQEGKSLPEKYRFILFEDRREIELVWKMNPNRRMKISGKASVQNRAARSRT